jgi:hypothetical protein
VRLEVGEDAAYVERDVRQASVRKPLPQVRSGPDGAIGGNKLRWSIRPDPRRALSSSKPRYRVAPDTRGSTDPAPPRALIPHLQATLKQPGAQLQLSRDLSTLTRCRVTAAWDDHQRSRARRSGDSLRQGEAGAPIGAPARGGSRSAQSSSPALAHIIGARRAHRGNDLLGVDALR